MEEWLGAWGTAPARRARGRLFFPALRFPSLDPPPTPPPPPSHSDALDKHSTSLRLDLQDVVDFDADLGAALEDAPTTFLPLLEDAAAAYVQHKAAREPGGGDAPPPPDVQVRE